MKKRIISLILLVLFLMQSVVFAADVRVYTEEDTEQIVNKLNMLGVFEKFDDEVFFGDNYPLKRSEAAVVISGVLGMGEGASAATSFFDVPQYSGYLEAVSFVTSLGIMSVNENGLFFPDNELEVGHALKTMVVALGYQWEAERFGGYPDGYIRVANELGLMKGISLGIYDEITRIDFLKIVNNALDKPICVMTNVGSENVDFEIDEDVNILSEYHNIFKEKGIVKNDKIISISGNSKIDTETVVIGDMKLFVNGVNEIYSYFGCEVEFYYKRDVAKDKLYLLDAWITSKNTINYIIRKDFVSYKNGEISYVDDSGDIEEIQVSSSVNAVYNGDVITAKTSEKINDFKGILKLIDNDGDDIADVVIITNYTYDMVNRVNVENKRIYAENNVLSINDYETVSVIDTQTGENVDWTALAEGNVIGFAESDNKEKLVIKIVRTVLGVDISEVTDNTFVTSEGIEYGINTLNNENKLLIKPGAQVSLYVDEGYYAVWVSSETVSLPLGYLIAVSVDDKFGEEFLTGVKILVSNGEVKVFKVADQEKIIFNGKKVKTAEVKGLLSNVKSTYNLGGDGEVSQVISYKTDDEGALSEIYTITEDDDGKLFYEYGYKSYGKVNIRNDGYGSGRYGVDRSGQNYNFAIANTHPVFRVPESNQESSPDSYYSRRDYTNHNMRYGGWKIDSYVGDKLDIIPKAVVNFAEEVDTSVDIVGNGKMFFVEKFYETLSPEGESRYALKGIEDSEMVTYYLVDNLIDEVKGMKANDDNEDEKASLTPGDAVLVVKNAGEEIQAMEKVFDYETKSIKKVYEMASADSDCAIKLLNVYNLPEDAIMMEVYSENLAYGLPGEEKKTLINLQAHKRSGGSIFVYDEKTKTFSVGADEDIIDYQKDPDNYTNILVRYDDNYIYGMAFYNR